VAGSSKSLPTFHGGCWHSCWITFPSHVSRHISQSSRWTSTSESRWIVRCDWDCPKQLVHNDYESRILSKSFLFSTTQNPVVPAVAYALFFYLCYVTVHSQPRWAAIVLRGQRPQGSVWGGPSEAIITLLSMFCRGLFERQRCCKGRGGHAAIVSALDRVADFVDLTTSDSDFW
jgi:hypothetical protein